jgi:serine/threonine-protein kinase
MNIDKSSWERIKGHFDELIELETAQRADRLATLEIDPDDRTLLGSLLTAHDRSDVLLDSGSAPALLDLAEAGPADPDWSGRRLGPWRVDERIGRGGMSVVHRGQRVDGQFDKTVAIKVLDADQLASDQRNRLTEEVRILARLEHPGLARLIDSGQSEDGDPYLVMEYVQGIPLNDHVSEHRLSADQRVELVLQVARALQYAHQRQVIHCDVKPSNILVTPQGRVRLVDFGIAALDQAESSKEARLYCSPAYAAPERLLGAPPTTSQDIFALGAVLYRVLSGRNIRPHDSMTGTRITEQPTPPSVATTQAIEEIDSHAIDARELKGDLDAICMKAIAIDPDDRYISMSEFIADLEAWRNHRPVMARQGGRGYVLTRWLRRHVALAALGSLLVAALIGGTVISLDQARRAGEQAERAVASRDFLIGILEAADPTLEYGHDPTASELLRRGADRIQTQLDDQPDLLVELLYIIGKTQLERGLIDDARTSLDRAIELLGDGRRHSDAAGILASRGLVAYEAGLYEDSVAWLEQAVTAAEDNRIAQDDRHAILIQLADMQVVNYAPDPALAIIETVLAEQPSMDNRIPAMRVRGGALELSGRLEEAERVLTDALELQNAINPVHINAAKIENDLGIVYWRLQDLERSLAMHESSWQHKIEIYHEDHPQTLASLSNIAAVRSALGEHAQAAAAWQASLEGLLRLHGTEAHVDVVYTRGMMALSAYWQDQLTHARRTLQQALIARGTLSKSAAEVSWLDSLDALLTYEAGEPIDAAALGVGREACSRPSQRTPMGQRLCVAWWTLTGHDIASCPPISTRDEVSALTLTWPRRWGERWQTTVNGCEAVDRLTTDVPAGT